MDVTDGIAFKDSFYEMEENFRRKCSEDFDFRSRNPIMINFVMSQFLDGVQIWKSKVANFAPFILGILNMPSTFREKLGIGLFLSSLVTCKANCGAEKFLFEHCLLQELKMFNTGVTIIIMIKFFLCRAN